MDTLQDRKSLAENELVGSVLKYRDPFRRELDAFVLAGPKKAWTACQLPLLHSLQGKSESLTPRAAVPSPASLQTTARFRGSSPPAGVKRRKTFTLWK